MNHEELMARAQAARSHSYCPYSHYAVGAALLCADGTVYEGCNVENSSYTPTICAERVAFFKAIFDGKRDFTAIAICGGNVGQPTKTCTPCGVCRQVMSEFCGPDFEVIMSTGPDSFMVKSFKEILPYVFEL